jgi:sodium transport system permease protein
MSPRNVGIVFRKELVDITRDRRTLMFMIIFPVAIMPLLILIMGRLTTAGIERLQETPSKVAILGAENAPPQLIEFLESLEDAETMEAFFDKNVQELDPFVLGLLLAGADDQDLSKIEKPTPEQLEAAKKAKILRIVPFEHEIPKALLSSGALDEEEGGLAEARTAFRKTTKAAIEDKKLDAVLIFHPGFADAIEKGFGAEYTIVVSEAEDRSLEAQRKIMHFFRLGAKGVTLEQLRKNEVPKEVLSPLEMSTHNVGQKQNFLARLLPYFIILMCFSGGLYPAIDLGAGEKERGTLETLLVSPARRTELVVGKFLVIVVASLVAAALNVLSLSVTLALGMGEQIPGMVLRFDAVAAFVTLLLMLPTAAIFGAVLLSLSIFARSFKEAQSYAVPMNFVIVIPAFFSILPGFELTPTIALIPILNVSMALKEVWIGVVKIDSIAVIFASTLVYAAAAIAFCTYWFRRETVLFRS